MDICCLCLQRLENPKDMLDIDTLNLIQEFTGIELLLDVSSAGACLSCLKMLNDSCKFRTSAKESFQKFIDLQKISLMSTLDVKSEVKIEIGGSSEDSGDDPPPNYETVTISEYTEAISPPSSPVADDEVIKEKVRTKRRKKLLEPTLDVAMLHKNDPRRKFLKEPLQCSYCLKILPRPSVYETHLRTHTGERPFECSHCDKTFKTKHNLKVHSSIHTGIYPMYCEFKCGKGFHNRLDKKAHEAFHKNERPFACDQCDKRYIVAYALQVHKQQSHSNVAAFTCEVCGKSFSTKNPLKCHLRSHYQDRGFQCKICEKSFNFSSHLREHEQTHGEAKFSCDVCQSKFKCKSLLRKHKRRHNQERPFKCQFENCGKAYVVNSDLTKHMRTHTGY